MQDLKPVSLGEIGGGAAAELFAAEFERVLENIQDPNTEAEAKREIVIKLTLMPSETRDSATTLISCNSKLAGTKPHGTMLFIGREHRGGPLVAIERNQREPFPAKDQEPEGVLPLPQEAQHGR